MKYRFLFKGESIISTAPLHISYPSPRNDKSMPSYVIVGNQPYYAYMASAPRAGIRRQAAKHVVGRLRKFDPNAALTAEDARLLMIGGVKDSGTQGGYPTPQQLEMIRKRFPILDMFGMGDPLMFGGTLYMGIMTSVEAIALTHAAYGKPIVDPGTTIPIVRRALIQDPTIINFISDPDTLQEDATANRQRSQIKTAIDTWKKIARKRGNLLTRDNTAMVEARQLLASESGQTFAAVEAAEVWFDQYKQDMQSGGRKTVSEQNIQSTAFIPAQTSFNHIFEFHYSTAAAIGLFMAAWHDKYLFDPSIGGLVARGCGGYLNMRYAVSRQLDDGSLVDDCVIEIKPNIGIKFVSNKNSLLRELWDAWMTGDIRDYAYDFKSLMKIIAGDD